MSIGSKEIDIDDRPGSLRELDRLKAAHSALRAALDADYSVSHRFDMPFTCGYNVTRTRYYFDRHLPLVAHLRDQKSAPKTIHIRPYALEHEITESALQHVLKMDHEKAHHLATAAEYHRVTNDNIDLDSYRAWFARWIKADEIRASRITNLRIPPDFDTTPLESDQSPSGLALLRKVRDAMSTTRRSSRSWGKQRRHV